MKPGKKEYSSRHSPAFILLFLTRGPNYGASLLSAMEKEMPYFLGDSAMVYRTLHSLEAEGYVSTYWHTENNGQPKKIYSLTEQGWERLAYYAEDIQQRMANFNYFLTILAQAQEDKGKR